MNEQVENIWKGDKLGRMSEALILHRVIRDEVSTLALQDRSESYVLCIDAAYGQGKSWFLDRFHRHLALNHPIAFIDAWVDDANDEPFVAILAAISDALAPYLTTGSKASDRLKAATRAALPILGKAITGGAAKAAQRYLGDAIFEKSANELAKASDTQSRDRPLVQDVVESKVEKAGEAIGALVDKQAEAMIDEYKVRQTSRTLFKENMRSLVSSVSEQDGKISEPLIVMVDELDRCRPNYAIGLLEEIKHLFDIPGVVFVIAMHGDQITRSISAVYGAEFDSSEYLRRFFSRRYEMRRLSVNEIAEQQFEKLGLESDRFFAPQTLSGEHYHTLSVQNFIGAALDEMNVSPRECFPVMDGLRLFHDQWIEDIKIELVFLLPMLVNSVRGESLTGAPVWRNKLKILGTKSGVDRGPAAVNFGEAFTAFPALYGNALDRLASDQGGGGGQGYAFLRFSEEYRVRFKNSHIMGEPPKSIVTQYPDVVRLIERLTDDIADEFLYGVHEGDNS